MNFISKLWRAEPALSIALIRTAMGVAFAFGLNITDEQQTAILAFVAAGLALSVVTRSQVVPTAKVEERLTEKQADKVLHDQ